MPNLLEKVRYKWHGANAWPWADASVWNYALGNARRNGDRRAEVTYSFWLNEHVYSAVAIWHESSPDSSYRRGDTIQIQYNPSDPNQSYFPEKENLTAAFYSLIAIIAAIAIILALAITHAHAQTPTSTTATTAPKPEKTMDWPNLHRYQSENATLPTPSANEHRVVFFGDSITDNWGRKHGTFFPGKPYINRGISGQTTPQMLVRFQQDVVALHPAAVVILAGTNDIAGNTGPSTPQMIEDNFRSMAAIAKANNIKVVLASITPAAHYSWAPTIDPIPTILEVNQWLKQFCVAQKLVYLDYYTAMADDKGAMKPGLASDGVHPTEAGYAVMSPLAEAAITKALRQ